MPANHQRDQNNPPTAQGFDDTPLLNPEIDDESPIMSRRRRAEADEEAQNDDGPRPNPRPKGPAWKGEYAKSIVYGGLDAIVTSFSLISSISAGGRLSSVDVLVLGFANLVADGISMGFGDFVSSSTEKNMALMERDVTHWEVENHRGSKIMHLIQRYRALGMDPKDATTVSVRASSMLGMWTNVNSCMKWSYLKS